MKRIALATVVLAAAVGTGYFVYPDEFKQSAEVTANAALRVWDSIKANPLPVSLALGTFLLTVIYHKAKGKSLRESLEAAATRVTVVPVPTMTTGEPENPVVVRAKARTTRTQLVADQIGLQNRYRKLPDEIVKAEREACYSEQSVADAERTLADKQKTHVEAFAKLDALRKEKAIADAELSAIDNELKRLAEVV